MNNHLFDLDKDHYSRNSHYIKAHWAQSFEINVLPLLAEVSSSSIPNGSELVPKKHPKLNGMGKQ